MADLDLTNAASITAEINRLNAAIQLYTTSPENFSVLQTGSVKVDVTAFVQELRAQRDYLVTRLDAMPYFDMSDVSGCE
jgi:hypothetical protein